MKKSRTVNSPSCIRDKIKGKTWLLAAVEEGSYKLKPKIVTNRKKATILKFFRENLNSGIKVKTFGHKS